MSPSVNLELPEKFAALYHPGYRYRVFYGGRGGAKSISFARSLIARSYTDRILVLCTRQYQNSIQDSVHRTIGAQIYEMGLDPWFDIQKQTIICKLTGSQFIFKGLQNQIGEIKSMYGINIMWIEEAQSVVEEAYLILDPTIRENDSEVWISFNPYEESDPTYRRYVTSPPKNAIVVKVDWRDNPWFPRALEEQRQRMLHDDPENYDWIWEGACRKLSEAAVFHGKVHIQTFDEAPDRTHFYHGLDFGYAADPTALVRCWIRPSDEGYGEDLMIDREAYGHGIELDEMAQFLDNSCETARFWPIAADAARPETISYLGRQGFSVRAAEKWQGCVEDGVSHLRAFRKIVIHERLCPNTARDYRLYSYKVDKKALDAHGRPLILPLVEEKNDHACDATRYALDGMIQHRGGLGMWRRLMD